MTGHDILNLSFLVSVLFDSFLLSTYNTFEQLKLIQIVFVLIVSQLRSIWRLQTPKRAIPCNPRRLLYDVMWSHNWLNQLPCYFIVFILRTGILVWKVGTHPFPYVTQNKQGKRNKTPLPLPSEQFVMKVNLTVQKSVNLDVLISHKCYEGRNIHVSFGRTANYQNHFKIFKWFLFPTNDTTYFLTLIFKIPENESQNLIRPRWYPVYLTK